ncbi:hypothetical protein DFH09DRAFT_1364501 [Mycena vulgaris]|nr:hypothetical protein DFH09DRAFT_1364501 [Mycena vulgaris]
MDYESSDILGSSSFPVRNPGSANWSGFSKTAFFLALLLAAYVGAVRAWEALQKWREKSYRLSMRRRHGIPDNDHRPFNVAYAAVLRARREEEVANNKVHRVDVDQLYAEADQHAASVESNIRQRNQYRNSEPAWSNGPTNGLPGRFNPLAADTRYMPSSNGLPSSSSHPPNFTDRYNPNPTPAPPVVRFADEIEDAGLPRRGGPNTSSSPRKHQKRALEDYDVESDVPENPKKTRVEGDEFIDGDEDAEWEPRQKRGEKRVMREEDLDDEEEVGPPGRRTRGKRARKVSLENQDVFMASDDNADDMDVDEEDEWRDARPVARGKKRDAGSTFEEGEEGDEGDQAQKTRRKRRTVGKRKSDAAAQPSRGQKRDRDVDEESSEAEGVVPGTPIRSSRKTKKRGKKSKEVREDEEEGSLDEGSVSKGKGRPIGDEWESNGVLYKIGANGQRLRQALVKKAARRFTMPLDSQHPDRNANLEVCIETWLTEEEYNDFKARHLLAWQDSPKGTQEPESMPSTPAVVAEAPSTPTPNPVSKGKNLLWDSPASPFPVFAPSPAEKEQFRPKAHFRQSIAADLGVRVNPFEKVNALHVGGELARNGTRSNGRRVVAVRETLANNPGLPGLADSTNNMAAQAPLARRTFSKWEKQDLEAKAMMKMREANQAKVKEKELKEKLEKDKKDREVAAAAAAAAPIPTFSLTKPTESAKPPAISFTPPAPSAGPSTTQPPSLGLGPTPTAAAPAGSSTISFGPPSTSDKPQQSAPNPFAPPASAGPPLSNPFAKPPQSSDRAPAPASAPTSNTFAPPSAAGAGTLPAAASTAPSFSFPLAPSGGGFAQQADRPIASAPTRKPAQAPFAPGNAAPAPAPSSGAPTFSFAPPAQNATSSAQSSQAQGGQSLLSRMGGASKPAEASAPTPPTFSFKPAEQSAPKSAFAAPQQPKPAQSAFSFKPADQSVSKPPSAFAPPPQQQQQQQAPAAQAPGAVTPPAPKFNFAFAPKPATSSPATPSSLTGALGSTDPKPSGSAFSFAAPKPAEQQTTTPAGTPSFSFAPPKPAGQSAFSSPTPAPGAGQPEQKQSAFGNTSNFGFGAFGGGAAPKNVFGGGGAFGSSATKPAEEPAKAAPAFGTTTPASNTGAPAASTGAPAAAPAFNFAFGGSNNTSTTPAGTPTAASPFAPKPSAFGGSSVFGKPAGGEATSTTTPQGSPFGAAAPSIFGKPAASSPFGAPPTSSPFGNAAGTPSAFGFGAPSAGQQK